MIDTPRVYRMCAYPNGIEGGGDREPREGTTSLTEYAEAQHNGSREFSRAWPQFKVAAPGLRLSFLLCGPSLTLGLHFEGLAQKCMAGREAFRLSTSPCPSLARLQFTLALIPLRITDLHAKEAASPSSPIRSESCMLAAPDTPLETCAWYALSRLSDALRISCAQIGLWPLGRGPNVLSYMHGY